MPQRSKDQRTEKATSLATKIYSNLQANPKHQIDGWARKQRAAWGENVDHITRGTTSPLGGRATSSKPKK
jgi:hypothetical protein